MNRSRTLALAALLAFAGCGIIREAQLDMKDPMTLVYTTRLGLAQTYDTVAAGVETGAIGREKGVSLKGALDSGYASLELAENAIRAGGSGANELEKALNVLTAVRNDPALVTIINRAQPAAKPK